MNIKGGEILNRHRGKKNLCEHKGGDFSYVGIRRAFLYVGIGGHFFYVGIRGNFLCGHGGGGIFSMWGG